MSAKWLEASFQPVIAPRNVSGERGTNGANLAELMSRKRKPDEPILILTQLDIQYFKGLADAGVLHARDILIMLEKLGYNDKIEVKFTETDRT